MKTQEKKIIRTVLGDISSEDLGFTLPHEHLLLDFSFMFKPSQDKEESNKSYVEVSEDMQLLAWIMYDPFRNRDNLITIDEDIAISELNLYKRVGGISLVDTTSIGLGRDPLALARISRATGINVIMGSGYYVDVLHPAGMNSMTEDQITDEIIADIEVGVKDTGVRSGVIGEIGCSWPLTVNENKIIKAAVNAQIQTGMPLSIHPGRDQSAPMEILNLVQKYGGDLERLVICHMDRTISDFEILLDLVSSGCNIEYDFFGWEVSNFSISDQNMLNDAQRLDYIEKLISHGFVKNIFMSHDMFGKHRQVQYGGHGWGHIIEHVIPIMRERGLDPSVIDTITIENPKRFFER